MNDKKHQDTGAPGFFKFLVSLCFRGERSERVAVVALCCVQFALGFSSAWNKSPVYDEPAHLFAGYTYLRLGDFRMMPSHPPLAEMLAAAPLLLCDVELPDLETPDSLTAGGWRRGAQWQIGRGWLYLCGNDPDRIMRVARVPMLLIMVFGGVCLYRVTRAALGTGAGLFALALWTFSPSVLAHGRWVTTDLPAAVCFFGATFSFWRLTSTLSPGRFMTAALWVAALFLTKFSAVLFVPVAALMILTRIARRRSLRIRAGAAWSRAIAGGRRAARGGLMLAATMAIGVVTLLAIWASFGFRYAGAVDGEFHYALYGTNEPVTDPHRAWQTTCTDSDGKGTLSGRFIMWAADHKLLPEAYLFGLAYTFKSLAGRPAYLNGAIRFEGWWYYFPYVLAVKTPIALLILCGIGAVGWCKFLRNGDADRATRANEALRPVAIFLGVYTAAAMGSAVNIGHRHFLPVYPFLFLLAAGSTWWTRRNAHLLPKTIVVLLLVANAVTSLRAWPHYLPFFNVAAGGASRGWHHLSDSNIDWGQDLIHLHDYLQRNPNARSQAESLKLSYFGMGDPNYYLGSVEMLPSSPGFKPDVVAAMAPELPLHEYGEISPGLFAISVTQLTEMYLPERGPWSREQQARLDAGQAAVADFKNAEGDDEFAEAIYAHRGFLGRLFPPEARQAFVDDPARFTEYWPALRIEAVGQVQELRFLKLLGELRRREPMARIGGSILLYRVNDDDLRGLTK